MSEETDHMNIETEVSNDEVATSSNGKKIDSDDEKYEKVLKMQVDLLKDMYTEHKYNPTNHVKLPKYDRKLETRKWLEDLKEHLREAGNGHPFKDIVRGLLNISSDEELMKDNIYGLNHKCITTMLGSVVTDVTEREQRVWRVRNTLEKIANSFGFRDLAKEIYNTSKDLIEVKRLRDGLVMFNEDDGISNFDFIYQWYIVNRCQTGTVIGRNHPSLIKFDKLISGETAIELYRKLGTKPETFQLVMSQYISELKKLFKDEFIKEACIVKLAGVYVGSIMERVAMSESNRKILEEANNIINNKREVKLTELWKEMEWEKFYGERKLVNRRRKMIAGDTSRGTRLVTVIETDDSYGSGYKRGRGNDGRYDEGSRNFERAPMRDIPKAPSGFMMGLKKRGNGFKRNKPEGFEVFNGKVWCVDCGGPHRAGVHVFDKEGFPIEHLIRNDLKIFLSLDRSN